MEQSKPRTCTVEGCEAIHNCRGYCKRHYERFRIHGDPLFALVASRSEPKRACAVAACDRQSQLRGWCLQHYARYRRNGTPGTTAIRHVSAPGERRACSKCSEAAIARQMCATHYMQARRRDQSADQCVVIDCRSPQITREMCEMHYARWRRVGEPAGQRRLGAPAKRGIITYEAAHARVRSQFGGAHNYDCLACGADAQDWAYDHEDQSALSGGRSGCLYSTDPTHYIPLCKKCHSAFDADPDARWSDWISLKPSHTS